MSYSSDLIIDLAHFFLVFFLNPFLIPKESYLCFPPKHAVSLSLRYFVVIIPIFR